jgi:thiol:disulfide interchange protein DsbC
MFKFHPLVRLAQLALAATLSLGAAHLARAQDLSAAQVTALKQKLAQRLPELSNIDAIKASPLPGIYEVQVGTNLLYTDAKGDYVIDGHILDTRSQRNLTQERLDDINRIDFAALPFKDAVVWKNGTGARKLVIFADPNCGYCKRLEKDLQKVKDVTVYTFIIPILGDDSKVKADNILCMKDRTQSYRDWMLSGITPAKSFGSCANPVQRNMALAQKFKITGTPAMFFEDGSRLASAAPAETVEQRLVKASAALAAPTSGAKAGG